MFVDVRLPRRKETMLLYFEILCNGDIQRLKVEDSKEKKGPSLEGAEMMMELTFHSQPS